VLKYYTILPPPSLVNYVRFFWVLESDDPYTHRNLADGCIEFFFHYNGMFSEFLKDGQTQLSARSGIQGPSSNFKRFTINEPFGMFGTYLYPFALNKLFALPVTALTDQMPDLYSFLGNEGIVLEEKIMLAADNKARVRIMTQFLETKLSKSNTLLHPVFNAVHRLIHEKQNQRVEMLSAQYCLSTRQFERKFKELSGFSPKLYSRIMRFQAATANYRTTKKTLTSIAYDCGYYDQSHFIHDFKAFSGLHPRHYFSGSTEATKWIDGGWQE
jgi:AraC-like DNA-binding protein